MSARDSIRISVILLASLPALAQASTFTELRDRVEKRGTEQWLELDGLLRLRSELLHNLDLDRGLTPSGEPLFFVPLSDPTSQTLTHADMRLRTDLALNDPEHQVSVRVRVDVLDNVSLGSLPEGVPLSSVRQLSPSDAFHVKHAYGQIVLPIGLLQAGRMGSTFGLGMLANGGDCEDCDAGDVADRIAFATPLVGHIFALAYDFSASGPLSERKNGTRDIDIDATDDVRSFTFAALKYRTPQSIRRRSRAGKLTFDYGAYGSYRWQNNDVPASYLNLEEPVQITPAQIIARGYRAYAIDFWGRLVGSSFRVELEAAYLGATIDQASLIPGVLLSDPVTSSQLGAALESDVYLTDDFTLGLDFGFASGDPAPGFGAFVDPSDTEGQPGDIEGAQVAPPRDTSIDNFRFHSDYRVDRILFRELIGTVTDAVYFRPHVRWDAYRAGDGVLYATLAGVGSFAVEASSTPGQSAPLGIELDPEIGYTSDVGFRAALEYALLFPLSGFDNEPAGLSAKPAQLLRFRMGYAF